MKVLVLYNLPGTRERDIKIAEADSDTQVTAMGVNEALLGAGYETELSGITAEEVDTFGVGNAGLVVNLIEWVGKDWKLGVKAAERLEKLNVPFTGSDSFGYRITCDKAEMKKMFVRLNIKTPEWAILITGNEDIPSLHYPVIIKPISEHCGIGIDQNSLAKNETELRTKSRALIKNYDQGVLAEEFIEGRELQVTILEKKGQPWVLPPAEIDFKKKKGFIPVLTYESKWNENSWEEKLSKIKIARLPRTMAAGVDEIAKTCYREMGGRDYPRLDMRIRDGEVYVLELNNNPGLDFEEDDGIGVSARAAGFKSFSELTAHIVENALYRFGM